MPKNRGDQQKSEMKKDSSDLRRSKRSRNTKKKNLNDSVSLSDLESLETSKALTRRQAKIKLMKKKKDDGDEEWTVQSNVRYKDQRGNAKF